MNQRRPVWLLFSLAPPLSGGAASYADILMAQMARSERVRADMLFTERHRARKTGKIHGTKIRAILPRRDSLSHKNPITDMLAFCLTQFLVAMIIIAARLSPARPIVHIHGRYANCWLAAVVALCRADVIIDIRDRFYDKRVLRRFPKIACVSRHIFNDLSDCDNVTYLPLPMDFDHIRALADTPSAIPLPNGPYFLFAGSVSPAKGVDELCVAYARYRATTSQPLQLIMAGPIRGIYAPQPGVTMTGPLPPDRIYPLIKHASRVILPSKSEGLPRICLEAMVLGTPVLCPPGIAEFDAHCPNSVIAQITPEDVFTALTKPVDQLDFTQYPLDEHAAGACFARLEAFYLDHRPTTGPE